ncbi:MAG: DUF2789 family protein, partial [Rhizobacter sp.]
MAKGLLRNDSVMVSLRVWRAVGRPIRPTLGGAARAGNPEDRRGPDVGAVACPDASGCKRVCRFAGGWTRRRPTGRAATLFYARRDTFQKESRMDTINHEFHELFEQLGLPSSESDIRAFIAS